MSQENREKGYVPYTSDYDIDAQDVVALLGDGAHLVGHSYGGVVAMLAAGRCPQTVRSLTLIEPAAYRVAELRPIGRSGSSRRSSILHCVICGSNNARNDENQGVHSCRTQPHQTVFVSIYEEIGAGEPLLLINGQAGDHTGWDLVRDDFAGHYRVIVFAHRGTGLSDKPTEPPYSTRGFARDTIAILDSLGIPRAHAYGISMGGRIWGGRICQWLGIEYPDRIGALVLGCTTPGNAHGVRRPPEVDAIMANRPADPQEAMDALLSMMCSPAWIAAHPEYLERMREQALHPIPAYAQRLHYLASEGHDAWDLLPTIKAPTLVIHGSEDVVNPTANAYLLAERIPGAELYIVTGGQHGYFIEFREESSRVVNEFLARHRL